MLITIDSAIKDLQGKIPGVVTLLGYGGEAFLTNTLDFLWFEGRVQHHIGEQLESRVHVLPEARDECAGRIARRAGSKSGADLVRIGGNLESRPLFGAFGEHRRRKCGKARLIRRVVSLPLNTTRFADTTGKLCFST